MPAIMRLFVALALAGTVLAISLPSQGALWPVVVSVLAFAVLVWNIQSRRARDAALGRQVALTVAFIAAITLFINDVSIQKYGALGLYLLGIATFAALSGRYYFLERNVGFIIFFTVITGAWFSNTVVQAAYEWHTAGGLTANNNACATATTRFRLSAAWVASIAAAMCYAVAAMRSPLADHEPATRGSTIWIVAGSLAIAIYLGVTRWGIGRYKRHVFDRVEVSATAVREKRKSNAAALAGRRRLIRLPIR